jgi:hypothetical protein
MYVYNIIHNVFTCVILWYVWVLWKKCVPVLSILCYDSSDINITNVMIVVILILFNITNVMIMYLQNIIDIVSVPVFCLPLMPVYMNKHGMGDGSPLHA